MDMLKAQPDYQEYLDQMQRKRLDLIEKVVEGLARLGSTPVEIAAGIKAAGITAVPNDSDECALTKYVVQTVDGALRASTGRSTVEVDGSGFYVDVVLTEAQRDFVAEFDREAYPDIIDVEAHAAYKERLVD